MTGEFHFSRYASGQWEDELIKMQPADKRPRFDENGEAVRLSGVRAIGVYEAALDVE